MRAVNLKVEPFHFLNYLEVTGVKRLDNHGFLSIKGLIDSKDAAEYRRLSVNETWVCVKIEESGSDGQVFFYGVLTNFRISEESNVHTMLIELRTGSYLLDLIPHVRTFQKDTFSYQQVLDTCLKEEGGEAWISVKDENQSIGGFLLQYQETNWEFIKRMAHNAGTVLIPEFFTLGKRFHFGIQGGTVTRSIQAESYCLEKIYEEYQKKRQSSIEAIASPEYGIYRIRSREIYHLGDFATFQNKAYVIGEIRSWLEGGELWHEYALIMPRKTSMINPSQQSIQGLSLQATVTAVKRDKVQVAIGQDENQDSNNYRWFDYATMYSTPDGTGWYCMPEIGDEVRLTFPDAYEKNAYVASSVHLETEDSRNNPAMKSWKNKQNKEILFTPDALILRNNNGLSIELSDKNGIKMISNQEIVLQAARDIVISSANAGVQIQGNQEITMTQGCAQISVSEDINIVGGKINMN